ncbi:MAG: tetratricopeptide repeat protein [Rhodoferax sp.]|nr:tetratricopeptide repeat protein [Rhodoferax sp.]
MPPAKHQTAPLTDELTIDQAIQLAVDHHRGGRLLAAESLYRGILEVQPKHPDANHNLGILAVRAGNFEAALQFFKTALEANPNKVQFWVSYIEVLARTNQMDAARQVLERGLKVGLKGAAVDKLTVALAHPTIHDSVSRVAEEQKGVTTSEKQNVSPARKKPKKQKGIASGSATHGKNSEPNSADIDALLKHFNEGRYERARSLAQVMIQNFPLHPFGWKALGVILMEMGNSSESFIATQKAVKLMPGAADAHSNLGNTLRALGRFDEAEASCRQAISLKPDFAEAHNNLGNALRDLGRFEEAETSCRHAIALKPSLVAAHNNLGNVLRDLSRFEEAQAIYRQAIAIKPGYAEAHSNLGNTLRDLGRFEEAQASYRQAIALKPGYAEAHNNLGNALRDLGRLEEAETSYRQAIALKPDFAEAHSNLGNALRDLDRLEEAQASCRQAITLRPEFTEAHNNLGNAQRDLGRLEEAQASYRKAIALKPDYSLAKVGFAECVSLMRFHSITPSVYAATATALTEVWTRPSILSGVACNLLLLNPEINELLALEVGTRSNSTPSPYDADTFDRLGKDPLLLALLTSAPIPNRNLERLLTNVRLHLLNTALKTNKEGSNSTAGLAFFCSLAHQCFINEYVFACANEELQQAVQLKGLLADAITSATDIPPLWVIGVACYFPLFSVDNSETLLKRTCLTEIRDLLTLQIVEPLEELKLRSSIYSLTTIGKGVSAAVQSQYEANPYPRWIKVPKANTPKPINAFLQHKFPNVKILPIGNLHLPDILIAGCGTGQHPIQTATNIRGARLLAIDLSAASLCYAKRKTQEMGIANIEYAKADILKLTSIGRAFDVIESVGVLHHLENPFDAWRQLSSMLRPNGLMRLGFYSEIARRDVVKARNLIRQRGYGSMPNDIREARQWLLEMDRTDNLGSAVRSADFYSLSACRDLLFHVQEHRMTLKQISEFIVGNNLMFLGFEFTDSRVTSAYKLRFAEDKAATNLTNWEVFEQENPDTFIGMYQFWVQKNTE